MELRIELKNFLSEIGGMEFQRFCAYLFERLKHRKFKVLHNYTTGKDKNIDLEIVETKENNEMINWKVQCKNYTDKSLTVKSMENEIDNFILNNPLLTEKYYMLIVTFRITKSFQEAFDKYTSDKFNESETVGFEELIRWITLDCPDIIKDYRKAISTKYRLNPNNFNTKLKIIKHNEKFIRYFNIMFKQIEKMRYLNLMPINESSSNQNYKYYNELNGVTAITHYIDENDFGVWLRIEDLMHIHVKADNSDKTLELLQVGYLPFSSIIKNFNSNSYIEKWLYCDFKDKVYPFEKYKLVGCDSQMDHFIDIPEVINISVTTTSEEIVNIYHGRKWFELIDYDTPMLVGLDEYEGLDNQ